MQISYIELKLSWELFAKAPETLSDPERSRLANIAAKQRKIEQCILSSVEAVNVAVPQSTLKNRLKEIRMRYPNDDEFSQDMKRIGIDEIGLGEAIERDLRVEAVLEKVASEAMPVSAVDAEIYYRLHPEAFDRPETRPSYPDHRRQPRGKDQGANSTRSTTLDAKRYRAIRRGGTASFTMPNGAGRRPTGYGQAPAALPGVGARCLCAFRRGNQ